MDFISILRPIIIGFAVSLITAILYETILDKIENSMYYYFMSYNFAYKGGQGSGYLEIASMGKITTFEDIVQAVKMIEEGIRENVGLTEEDNVQVTIINYQLLRREKKTKEKNKRKNVNNVNIAKVKGNGNNIKQEILEGERNGKEV